jgi:hypothetical protein
MLMNSACKDYEKFHFIPPLLYHYGVPIMADEVLRVAAFLLCVSLVLSST